MSSYTRVFQDGGATIVLGDSREVVRSLLPVSSVFAVVTDPPYGINYDGNAWDRRLPSSEVWKACLRACVPGAYMLACGSPRTYHRLALSVEHAGFELIDCLMWMHTQGMSRGSNIGEKMRRAGVGGSDRFDGRCSVLKPAYEPIVLCRRPLEGSEAENAEKYGVSGLAFDACRTPSGRAPCNVVMDGAAGALAETMIEGASRFVFVPKPDREERADNEHPTVKPIALMRYLIRLVRPPAGLADRLVLLDPFVGSGSTAVAAVMEGVPVFAVERDERYWEIACRRVSVAVRDREKKMQKDSSSPLDLPKT